MGVGVRVTASVRLRARTGGGPTGLQEGGLPLVLEGGAALDDGLPVREQVTLVDQADELLRVYSRYSVGNTPVIRRY